MLIKNEQISKKTIEIGQKKCNPNCQQKIHNQNCQQKIYNIFSLVKKRTEKTLICLFILFGVVFLGNVQFNILLKLASSKRKK